MIKTKSVMAVLALIFAASALAGVVQAQERPITRGIPKAGEIKKQLTRGISPDQDISGRPVSELPTMDVMVRFKFDSSELTPFAMKQLDAFGAALQSDELAHYTIIIAGHTDAVGSATYNRELSERRAKSVYDYLVEMHDIDRTRLMTRGVGEDQLYNPADPTAAENRRVSFINRGR